MIRIIASVIVPIFVLFILKMIITDYDKCYSSMEYEGHAAMGSCGGIFGGTEDTDYLSESCIDCPYFVMLEKEENKND